MASGAGNLFAADDNNHAVPLGNKGTMEINVRWQPNSSLSVSYPKNALVFLKNPSEAGVAVKYEAVP